MSDKQVNLMWHMYADTAMELFKRIEERGAKTEEERTAILFELMEEGKIERLVQTERSKEQIISDLKKNFNVATPEDLIDKD